MKVLRQSKSLKDTPRYCGIPTFFNKPHTKELTGVDIAILGIPFEMGSAPGNIHAPRAVRNVSWLVRSTNSYHLYDTSALKIVDYGDVTAYPSQYEKTFDNIEEEVTEIVEAGVVPICVGGDHSITYAELKAINKVYPELALLQFDAHTDTHDSYFGDQRFTSGSVFRRAVEEKLIEPGISVQVGLRGTLYSENDYKVSEELGFQVTTAEEVQEVGIEKVVSKIINRLEGKKVFLSFDTDVLDPAFAPGTARPEPGGLMSSEVFRILRRLEGIDFVGFDTAEFNPSHDVGNITAVLVANIIFEFISLIGLRKYRNDNPREGV